MVIMSRNTVDLRLRRCWEKLPQDGPGKPHLQPRPADAMLRSWADQSNIARISGSLDAKTVQLVYTRNVKYELQGGQHTLTMHHELQLPLSLSKLTLSEGL